MPAFANVTAELTEVYLMTAVGMDVTLGVDTHKDTHVGAVLDNLGRCLAVSEFKADVSGSRRLLAWASGYGFVRSAGVEGTGSYGYRVAQFLTHSGVSVFEVSRPDRSTRRRKGKSDSVDAESAARAVLAGEATAVPKDREGPVGALRAIVVARRSAVKARTQAFNQIHALLVGCDDRLRTKAERSRPLTLASGCSRLRPTNGSRLALRSLGRRWLYLNNEVAALDAEIGAIVRRVAPRLLQRHSVGVQTAAQLLVTAGDNADRIRTEAALAALCGTSPVEASSGKSQRHRLNQGGDRAANTALWTIANVRLIHDPRTRAYGARRKASGSSRREILRMLKRYIVRELYPIIIDGLETARQAAA